MKKIIWAVLICGGITFAQNPDSIDLHNIQAFQQVIDSLASSGYVEDQQFDLIKKAGYTHIITLIPVIRAMRNQ